LLIGLVGLGCEKEVDLPLNSTKPVPVLDGLLTSLREPAFVRLSWSGSYRNYTFTPIAEAQNVRLTDGVSVWPMVYNTGFAVYQTPDTLELRPLQWYTLRFELQGEAWEARTFMDTVSGTQFITATYDPRPERPSQAGWYLRLFAQDPPGQRNYYRYRVYRNDTLQGNPLNVTDDRFFDGKLAFIDLRPRFRKGDTARVDVLSIDEAQYQFWSQILQANRASTGTVAQTPGNPPTNLRNLTNPERRGVGFLAASSVRSLIRVIQ
jgi:hypothetical protein